MFISNPININMICLKITHPSKGFYVPSVLCSLFVLNNFYSLLSFLLTSHLPGRTEQNAGENVHLDPFIKDV